MSHAVLCSPPSLLPPSSFVDSVGDAVDTHVHIEQSYLVVTQQQIAIQLYHLLARHMREEPEFKVGGLPYLSSDIQVRSLYGHLGVAPTEAVSQHGPQ